ncbi:MAG: ATP-binding protein [Magnetospirillum sp.]|nr:ATP-binding protein [Magnetospirillum sp.]
MTLFQKLKLRGGRRMSLRGKVLLVALTSVCLINIVSAAFTTALVISKKRDELKAGATMLAAMEAQSLASPLWNFNHPAMRDALNALTHNPDFANATVMDANGVVLATVVAPEDFAAGTLSGDSPIVWEGEGRRRLLGSVHIQLTTRSLWEFGKQQASTMLTTLLLTCGAVAAAILLAFRLIASPLGRVAVATEMLGRGYHDLTVPEQEREDEIGNIARAVEMSRRQMATIERLRLEQSRYLKTVFANAANGIMEADRDGRIETVNPAAERIFALPAHQLIGMRLNRLMPGLDPQGGEMLEVETYRANGDAATLSVSCSGFEIAGGHKVSVIVHDITERKAAERALDAARRTAEDSSRTKSAFLANMSHEIRTPMNAIIGLTRLVLGSSLTDRQRDHLEKVLTSAHGLLGIINDILDLSKIEAGKMTMEATDFSLEDLFEELADINGLRAREKQLELVFNLPPLLPEPLVGDPVRLRQVLVNLIGNAIKFTERGEVLVSVALDSQAERSVVLRFSVRDTGIGMEPWQLDKVFDAFSQADVSTTRKFGGTGLGLAICYNLVSLMGGTIGVDSKADVGSHFWFTVPFGIRSGADERALPEPSPQREVRVLAVEANPSAREVLGNILDSFQYPHVLAETEEDALAAQSAALEGNLPFHLTLVGETLPDADGVVAIRRLKRGQGDLRAVLMAAPESAEGLADGDEDIIDAFLTKPVTPSRLLDTILTALRAHGATQRQGGRRPSCTENIPAPDLRGVRLLLAEDNVINRELALEVLKHSGAEIELAGTGVEAVARVQEGGSTRC